MTVSIRVSTCVQVGDLVTVMGFGRLGGGLLGDLV